MKNEINVELPKWPQMIVTGDTISSNQALEIIRRTDNFFTNGGGNYHGWNDKVEKLTKMVNVFNFEHGDYDQLYKARKYWEMRWGYISCEYVQNDWISCCYILGPHGWCHPDGKIGYCDNIGKWPSLCDIQGDWEKIAKEFPFLNITATLMDSESEQSGNPVVHLVISKGQVKCIPYSSDSQMLKLHGGKEKLSSAFDRYSCRGESAIDINIIKS